MIRIHRYMIVLLLVIVFASSGCIGTPTETDYSEVPFAIFGHSTILPQENLTSDQYLKKYNETYGPLSPPTNVQDFTLMFFDNPYLLDPPETIQLTFLIYGDPYTCILKNSVPNQSRYYGIYWGQLTEDPATLFNIRLGYGNAVSASIPWQEKRIEIHPIQSEKYVSQIPTTKEGVGSFHRVHIVYMRDDPDVVFHSPVYPAEKTGSLLVKAVPPDAYVIIDDVVIGYADGHHPWTNIPTGNHMVKVAKAGYDEYCMEVNISDESNAKIAAVLNRSVSSAGLVVNAVPLESEVYVDKKHFFGSVYYPDIHITGISPGVHTVRIEAEGYDSLTLENFSFTKGYVYHIKNIRLAKSGSGQMIDLQDLEITLEKM
ncbi:PEGA domain-containing protein [Methanorbis rubei]|uniref:PEGA domain-containing protein n=1 Tax=Methanorbis rubei TaxID=3028300 RepID=A0AAE4SBK9_9EURY|nr:hypothetical protein [Methanocorpusculaceae archaeon Cs1]